ncbi:tetratricopeptide repeat protein [Chelativorans sp. M5D2P16]|uniref:tetratricopeptide repeat protein n=1 Tax=Chelativorans sp. M5D2P16 TaxID=3095678 RepID=UPI002AC9F3C0|nr:tetratricopeptide repeat protein [Chelativorans sp. M5D2P16]MDZ5699311.1 tetratricopeptide repeat protein [Chelativorans sp. M5D2P16]
MRYRLFPGLLSFALLTAPVAAQEPSDAAFGPDRLEQLFTELKQETNEAAARRIARRIREQWLDSGGATADLLIEWARDAAAEEKYHVALDLLDQAVVLYPDYVEGWSNRAMVFLQMQDYERAMSDLARTLAIEPRHFGALSGLAGILRASGHEERALEVYRRMLEVYPMQRSAQRALMTLVEDQTDERL